MTANDKLDPAHVQWSRNVFACLKDGGVWGLPRSGLLFVRRGNEFHLTARLPHDPAMPLSAAELRKQQDTDFDLVKANFGAAGVPVIDKAAKESVR
jgi:hypothetical protein